MTYSQPSLESVNLFASNLLEHCKAFATPHYEKAIQAYGNLPTVEKMTLVTRTYIDNWRATAAIHGNTALGECAKYTNHVVEKIPLPIVALVTETANETLKYHKTLNSMIVENYEAIPATVLDLSSLGVSGAFLSATTAILLWCGAGVLYAKVTDNSIRTSLIASLTLSSLYTLANQPQVQALITPYCSPISTGVTLVALASLVTWKTSHGMEKTRSRNILPVNGAPIITAVNAKKKGISLTKAVATVCSPAVVPAVFYAARHLISAMNSAVVA
ncbi:MAG: hypothetical protein Q8K75_02080 [Chlamydiales bacterium]|nr:hypothetical protein [Chlamydiales bacterium]